MGHSPKFECCLSSIWSARVRWEFPLHTYSKFCGFNHHKPTFTHTLWPGTFQEFTKYALSSSLNAALIRCNTKKMCSGTQKWHSNWTLNQNSSEYLQNVSPPLCRVLPHGLIPVLLGALKMLVLKNRDVILWKSAFLSHQIFDSYLFKMVKIQLRSPTLHTIGRTTSVSN